MITRDVSVKKSGQFSR